MTADLEHYLYIVCMRIGGYNVIVNAYDGLM